MRKGNMRLRLSAFAVLLAPVLALAACDSTGPDATPTDALGVVTIEPDDVLPIGFWGVLSGPDLTLGEDARRGVVLAIEDRDGELLGHHIALRSEDAGCSEQGGLAAATRLANDESLVALVGSACSSEAAAGVPVLTNAGMTTISPVNTAPAFTDPELRGPGGALEQTFAGYLRTAHSDAVQGAVAAKFAYNELGLRTAATIHDGTQYPEALQQVFADTFTALGGTITAQEEVAPTEEDMGAVLTTIAVDSPDLIYLPLYLGAGSHVVEQAPGTDGLEDVILLAADAMFSPEFVEAAGASAEGVFLTSPDVTAFTEGYDDFLDRHRARYGGEPVGIFHAHAYDAANILFDAIERAAVVEDDGTLHIGRQALRDEMFDTADYDGLIGTLTCDEFGDCSSPIIAVYEVTAREVGGVWPPAAPTWRP